MPVGALLTLIPAFAWGGPAAPEPHGQAPDEHIPAAVIVPDRAALARLQDHPLTLDHGPRLLESGAILQPVLARPEVLEALRREGVQVQEQPLAVLSVSEQGEASQQGYRSPEEGGQLLAELAAIHPRSGLAVLGWSVEGRPIDALWLGQPPTSEAPVLRVLGAHHGDEWSSFELALALAEELVARDGLDPKVTELLDRATIWVVPYVNPDGVVARRRYNARGVDLNRNYDFQWRSSAYRAGPAPFSEPETRAVRALFQYDPPLLGLSLHSGAVNIGYVWNWTTEPADDRPLLEELAWGYAELTQAPGFWVTAGADWYVTHGDTNDWSYGRFGVLDFTVELTYAKSPRPEAIPTFLADHLDAALAFLRLPDVSATVVDAPTGQPLSARVRLLDAHDVSLSAWVHTDPETGRFHRVTSKPAARLEVHALGYEAQIVPLGDGEPVVSLKRAGLAAGRVAPAVVSGPTTVRLPDDIEGVVTLARAGHEPVQFVAHSGSVSLEALNPGPWTVLLPDGRVLPHALLVTGDGRAALSDWRVEGGVLSLEGQHFAPGSRAWGLWGTPRSLVPLPVVEESAERLRIALDPAPPGEPLDVLVLTGGSHLAMTDVHGSPLPDGISPDRPGVLEGGCACASGPGGPLPAGPLLLLLLWSRRRRSP